MTTPTYEHFQAELTEVFLPEQSLGERNSDHESFADVGHLAEMLAEQRLRLTRFVRKHLKNEDFIGDVVQQACFEAYRNWGNFKGESKPETWLFGIAFNLMRNFKTKQYRFNTTFEPLEDSHFDNLYDEADQPMEAMMRREEIDHLEASIEQLPKRMGSVVKCVLLEGLSYQDTAERLGLPVGTVRSRLSRARDLLRELMEEQQEN